MDITDILNLVERQFKVALPIRSPSPPSVRQEAIRTHQSPVNLMVERRFKKEGRTYSGWCRTKFKALKVKIEANRYKGCKVYVADPPLEMRTYGPGACLRYQGKDSEGEWYWLHDHAALDPASALYNLERTLTESYQLAHNVK